MASTRTVREALATLLEKSSPKFGRWLTEVAEGYNYTVGKGSKARTFYVRPDPARALDLVIRIAEYHIPKLQRTIVQGDGPNGEIVLKIQSEDTHL